MKGKNYLVLVLSFLMVIGISSFAFAQTIDTIGVHPSVSGTFGSQANAVSGGEAYADFGSAGTGEMFFAGTAGDSASHTFTVNITLAGATDKPESNIILSDVEYFDISSAI